MDRKQLLKLYGKYSFRLAQLLKEEGQLETEEQIFIENHVLILQLAVTLSKYPKKIASAK